MCASAREICQLIWIFIVIYACTVPIGALLHAATQRIRRAFENINVGEKLQRRNGWRWKFVWHNATTFVVVQKRPAIERITLHRAQHRIWFHERSIGKCNPALCARETRIKCVVVIGYSLLSVRKVVRLKPYQPDRWLRPCNSLWPWTKFACARHWRTSTVCFYTVPSLSITEEGWINVAHIVVVMWDTFSLEGSLLYGRGGESIFGRRAFLQWERA